MKQEMDDQYAAIRQVSKGFRLAMDGWEHVAMAAVFAKQREMMEFDYSDEDHPRTQMVMHATSFFPNRKGCGGGRNNGE